MVAIANDGGGGGGGGIRAHQATKTTPTTPTTQTAQVGQPAVPQAAVQIQAAYVSPQAMAQLGADVRQTYVPSADPARDQALIKQFAAQMAQSRPGVAAPSTPVASKIAANNAIDGEFKAAFKSLTLLQRQAVKSAMINACTQAEVFGASVEDTLPVVEKLLIDSIKNETLKATVDDLKAPFAGVALMSSLKGRGADRAPEEFQGFQGMYKEVLASLPKATQGKVEAARLEAQQGYPSIPKEFVNDFMQRMVAGAIKTDNLEACLDKMKDSAAMGEMLTVAYFGGSPVVLNPSTDAEKAFNEAVEWLPLPRQIELGNALKKASADATTYGTPKDFAETALRKMVVDAAKKGGASVNQLIGKLSRLEVGAEISRAYSASRPDLGLIIDPLPNETPGPAVDVGLDPYAPIFTTMPVDPSFNFIAVPVLNSNQSVTFANGDRFDGSRIRNAAGEVYATAVRNRDGTFTGEFVGPSGKPVSAEQRAVIAQGFATGLTTSFDPRAGKPTGTTQLPPTPYELRMAEEAKARASVQKEVRQVDSKGRIL